MLSIYFVTSFLVEGKPSSGFGVLYQGKHILRDVSNSKGKKVLFWEKCHMEMNTMDSLKYK